MGVPAGRNSKARQRTVTGCRASSCSKLEATRKHHGHAKSDQTSIRIRSWDITNSMKCGLLTCGRSLLEAGSAASQPHQDRQGTDRIVRWNPVSCQSRGRLGLATGAQGGSLARRTWPNPPSGVPPRPTPRRRLPHLPGRWFLVPSRPTGTAAPKQNHQTAGDSLVGHDLRWSRDSRWSRWKGGDEQNGPILKRIGPPNAMGHRPAQMKPCWRHFSKMGTISPSAHATASSGVISPRAARANMLGMMKVSKTSPMAGLATPG